MKMYDQDVAPAGPGRPDTSSTDNLGGHPARAAVCGGASPNRRYAPSSIIIENHTVP